MISNISNGLILGLFLWIMIEGIRKKADTYGAFLSGVTEGIRIVWELVPTLLGLMMAVGMMRASGILDFLGRLCLPIGRRLHLSSELIPLILAKIFSSSAATGILLDLFKQYGPDSEIGFTASLILCSTETVCYTVSVYYGYIDVNKTRWTIPGAFLCILMGTIASVMLANFIVK